MGRDDAVEWDNWCRGLVVDECYIKSSIFFSCRNTGFNGSSRFCTIQNNLVHDLPCRIDGVADRSPPLFKINANSIEFDLHDNIFAITQSSYLQGGDPFGELITHNKIRNSSGNVICWLGGGAYPEPVPDGFTALTGGTAQDTWDDALAAWWDTFPGPSARRRSGGAVINILLSILWGAFIACAIFFGAIQIASPAAAQVQCMRTGQLVDELRGKYQERQLLWRKPAETGVVVQLWGRTGGTWSIVAHRNSGVSCVLASGKDMPAWASDMDGQLL